MRGEPGEEIRFTAGVYLLRAYSLPKAIDHTVSDSMLEMRPHTTLKLHLGPGWGEQMPGQKSMGGYKPWWTREALAYIPAIDECQVRFIKPL